MMSTPACYMIFDVLYLDEPLVARPWSQRRASLEALSLDQAPIAVPPVFYSDPDLLLDAARERGLEGVVSKRMDSPYRPGRRSPTWVKTALFQRSIRIGQCVVPNPQWQAARTCLVGVMQRQPAHAAASVADRFLDALDAGTAYLSQVEIGDVEPDHC
jgi:ATP-dependent DNA ligase